MLTGLINVGFNYIDRADPAIGTMTAQKYLKSTEIN